MQVQNRTLIAAVEDEPDILNLLRISIERAGFTFVGFEKGEDLFHWLDQNPPPNLFLVDILLPDIDGFDICKRLRSTPEYNDLPIIILTALDSETDKVLGLEIGADDYIVKPFSTRELVARIKAVLRRYKPHKENEGSTTLQVEKLLLNKDEFSASYDGKKINLTSTEFKLLSILVENKEKVISRKRLIELLWGDDKAVTERSIDVHIKKIRDKLGEGGKLIKSIRGIGYILSEKS
jgi:DNA-binding response OmpR family regulator